MSYVAICDEQHLSTHKTYNGALKSLMEYRGFMKKQIRDALKNGEDITTFDYDCRIVETIR